MKDQINRVKYEKITMEQIVDALRAYYGVPEPVERNIRMMTGTRGLYTYNWGIALRCGMIPESVERREVKLVGRLNQYTKEMVDENGEIWAWQPAYGKIHWTRLKLRADVPKRRDPRESRFNQWEDAVHKLLYPWMSYKEWLFHKNYYGL